MLIDRGVLAHLLYLLGGVSCVFTPVVEVAQGRLRGLWSVSGQNRYYGVPYARSRRFQPPQPPAKWDGVFNAVHRLGTCAQTVSFLRGGTEDCLHLDVYTPENSRGRLPVFVFIHGGGYYYGAKWNYDPEFLVSKNIVSVIVNYRLGVFGFFCSNGTANLGLKDQVAALRWIRQNIAAFGGDPDNVTISGQSAGASAAAMHLFSKASAGLFHKLFLLSGTALSTWAYNLDHKNAALNDARKLTKIDSFDDVLEVFSTATVADLLNATQDTSINPKHFKYSPCMDAEFADPFFEDTPYNSIISGNFNKVPIINGYVNLEGILFYGLHDEKTLQELDENFLERLPTIFSWCPSNKMAIAEKLRAHYFQGGITKASLSGVMSFYSDWLAYGTADYFTELMARYSDLPIYSYIFAYEGDRNFAKFLFGTRVRGASHSDDIFYIFKPAGLSMLLSAQDRLFIDRFTTMLANFMLYGNPTPIKTRLLPVTWPRWSSNRSLSLMLDRTLRVSETPSSIQGRFYHQLLCEYGLEGYVPCASEMRCYDDSNVL